MYASNQTQEQYPWWARNARFIDLSNNSIMAPVAQAILMMLKNWQQNLILVNDNPKLAYQQPRQSQPQPFPLLQYQIPQAEPQPYLKQKQSFEDYFYRPSQGIEQPALTRINRVENTLYQTTYQSQKYSFYQSPKPLKDKTMFGYSSNSLMQLYEQPKTRTKASAYSQPMETVFYETKHNRN